MRRRVIAALALATMLATPAAAQPEARESIATVRQRASFTPSAEPVKIRGTVTLMDARRALVVVQDATGDLVVIPATPATGLGAGPVVEVAGTATTTDRGFTVLDAEDGRADLDPCRQHQDRIDVLVTDVVMPRMNGVDLAKEVEKIRPGMQILFISGYPERSGSGLDPTGVTNLLMKPFPAETLAARITELITGTPEADG